MIIPVCTHARTPLEVLPALAAVGTELRRVALRPEALRELSDAETVLVDGRHDLHAARRVCELLLERRTVAVVVVVAEGGLVTLGSQLAPAQFLLPDARPAEVRARLALARSALRVGPRRDRASRVGSLTLERDRHRAVVDGRDLHLSEREFAVLAVLAAPPTARVVPRRELLERAWGSRWYDPGAVAPVVRRLRTELGGAAVESVRGVGYRLRIECLFG